MIQLRYLHCISYLCTWCIIKIMLCAFEITITMLTYIKTPLLFIWFKSRCWWVHNWGPVLVSLICLRVVPETDLQLAAYWYLLLDYNGRSVGCLVESVLLVLKNSTKHLMLLIYNPTELKNQVWIFSIICWKVLVLNIAGKLSKMNTVQP